MWGLVVLLLRGIGIDFVPALASLLSTDVAAINLLFSIFMCYPMAIIYHKYVRVSFNGKEFIRHFYFIAMGFDMAYFNFGFKMYHNIIPILVIYVTNTVVGPGKLQCLVTFCFNMIYLVGGYIYTESENYDITWTMPHCVITLKLIALSFDLWDGLKLEKQIDVPESIKRIDTAVPTLPSLMEIFGYVYFPPCFLVGPIFSFRRYKHFVMDVFPLKGKPFTYDRQKASLKTLLSGLLLLAIYQVAGAYFSMDYMLSKEFLEKGILSRHIYCGIWSYTALSKYISCWLLTEGACILFGLSYNGYKDGLSHWDACRNVKLGRFITSTRFQHYIDSFNCNTNHFAAEYIYKRLKFLGNKSASQGLTLFFLALWHGVHSGYYATFFNEFMLIYFEKGLEDFLKKTPYYTLLTTTPLKYLYLPLLKLYTLVYLGWSLTPFDVKLGSKWVYVYSTMWFSGYVIFLPWGFVYKPLLIKLFKKANLYKN